MRFLLVVAVVLGLAAVANGLGGAKALPRLEIPAGRPVMVDGVLSAGEWDDAATVDIGVSRDWVVRVLVKHDTSNLYFAFTHLRHLGAERYPEVLLDPASVGEKTDRPTARFPKDAPRKPAAADAREAANRCAAAQ